MDYHHNEDDFFLKQDAAKREKLRQQLEEKARAAQLGGALKTDDQSILQLGTQLGLTPETAKVLHLIPLVHVAWADGDVTAKERLTILQAAELHGAAPGSEAGTFLATLLEKKPDPKWLDGIHQLIRGLAKRGQSQAHNIVELAKDVAGASGGVLGFGNKISDEERQLIEQFAQAYGSAADRETKSLVE